MSAETMDNVAITSYSDINQISLYALASRFPDHSISVRGTATMQSISSELERAAQRSSGLAVFYAGFQRLSAFPPQAATYYALSEHLREVYAFGLADMQMEAVGRVQYVRLNTAAPLAREWFIVYNAPDFHAALLTHDTSGFDVPYAQRKFEGILSFDAEIVAEAERLIGTAMGQTGSTMTERSDSQRIAHQLQVNRITDRVLGRLEESNRRLQAAYAQLQELNSENERMQRLLQGLLAQETWQSVSEAAQQGENLPQAKSVNVSVLFTDIVGFTAISERYPPAIVVRTLNRYFGLLAPIIYRHGGDIDKYIGDGLMATFTDAKEAVAAGQEVLQVVHRFNEAQHLSQRPRLETRIGLANGPAILGNIGGQNRMDRTYIGDAVNLAARLQALAAPGALLVSADVWQQVGRPTNFSQRDGVNVKGKSEPIAVYEWQSKE